MADKNSFICVVNVTVFCWIEQHDPSCRSEEAQLYFQDLEVRGILIADSSEGPRDEKAMQDQTKQVVTTSSTLLCTHITSMAG